MHTYKKTNPDSESADTVGYSLTLVISISHPIYHSLYPVLQLQVTYQVPRPQEFITNATVFTCSG